MPQTPPQKATKPLLFEIAAAGSLSKRQLIALPDLRERYEPQVIAQSFALLKRRGMVEDTGHTVAGRPDLGNLWRLTIEGKKVVDGEIARKAEREIAAYRSVEHPTT